ncbi:hypothetical protein VP01_74g3 [Puccinia sorghi]|uniref:Uncharacterized protein n=1 Tax=Puccinia sorghi TaxID=27349 RepID=A0A0L6UEA3_9BASI|nr:hypothetical protein VP01_74g3 [Puccinia sorghi]
MGFFCFGFARLIGYDFLIMFYAWNLLNLADIINTVEKGALWICLSLYLIQSTFIHHKCFVDLIEASSALAKLILEGTLSASLFTLSDLQLNYMLDTFPLLLLQLKHGISELNWKANPHHLMENTEGRPQGPQGLLHHDTPRYACIPFGTLYYLDKSVKLKRNILPDMAHHFLWLNQQGGFRVENCQKNLNFLLKIVRKAQKTLVPTFTQDISQFIQNHLNIKPQEKGHIKLLYLKLTMASSHLGKFQATSSHLQITPFLKSLTDVPKENQKKKFLEGKCGTKGASMKKKLPVLFIYLSMSITHFTRPKTKETKLLGIQQSIFIITLNCMRINPGTQAPENITIKYLIKWITDQMHDFNNTFSMKSHVYHSGSTIKLSFLPLIGELAFSLRDRKPVQKASILKTYLFHSFFAEKIFFIIKSNFHKSNCLFLYYYPSFCTVRSMVYGIIVLQKIEYSQFEGDPNSRKPELVTIFNPRPEKKSGTQQITQETRGPSLLIASPFNQFFFSFISYLIGDYSPSVPLLWLAELQLNWRDKMAQEHLGLHMNRDEQLRSSEEIQLGTEVGLDNQDKLSFSLSSIRRRDEKKGIFIPIFTSVVESSTSIKFINTTILTVKVIVSTTTTIFPIIMLKTRTTATIPILINSIFMANIIKFSITISAIQIFIRFYGVGYLIVLLSMVAWVRIIMLGYQSFTLQKKTCSTACITVQYSQLLCTKDWLNHFWRKFGVTTEASWEFLDVNCRQAKVKAVEWSPSRMVILSASCATAKSGNYLILEKRAFGHIVLLFSFFFFIHSSWYLPFLSPPSCLSYHASLLLLSISGWLWLLLACVLSRELITTLPRSKKAMCTHCLAFLPNKAICTCLLCFWPGGSCPFVNLRWKKHIDKNMQSSLHCQHGVEGLNLLIRKYWPTCSCFFYLDPFCHFHFLLVEIHWMDKFACFGPPNHPDSLSQLLGTQSLESGIISGFWGANVVVRGLFVVIGLAFLAKLCWPVALFNRGIRLWLVVEFLQSEICILVLIGQFLRGNCQILCPFACFEKLTGLREGGNHLMYWSIAEVSFFYVFCPEKGSIVLASFIQFSWYCSLITCSGESYIIGYRLHSKCPRGDGRVSSGWLSHSCVQTFELEAQRRLVYHRFCTFLSLPINYITPVSHYQKFHQSFFSHFFILNSVLKFIMLNFFVSEIEFVDGRDEEGSEGAVNSEEFPGLAQGGAENDGRSKCGRERRRIKEGVLILHDQLRKSQEARNHQSHINTQILQPQNSTIHSTIKSITLNSTNPSSYYFLLCHSLFTLFFSHITSCRSYCMPGEIYLLLEVLYTSTQYSCGNKLQRNWVHSFNFTPDCDHYMEILGKNCSYTNALSGFAPTLNKATKMCCYTKLQQFVAENSQYKFCRGSVVLLTLQIWQKNNWLLCYAFFGPNSLIDSLERPSESAVSLEILFSTLHRIFHQLYTDLIISLATRIPSITSQMVNILSLIFLSAFVLLLQFLISALSLEGLKLVQRGLFVPNKAHFAFIFGGVSFSAGITQYLNTEAISPDFLNYTSITFNSFQTTLINTHSTTQCPDQSPLSGSWIKQSGNPIFHHQYTINPFWNQQNPKEDKRHMANREGDPQLHFSTILPIFVPAISHPSGISLFSHTFSLWHLLGQVGPNLTSKHIVDDSVPFYIPWIIIENFHHLHWYLTILLIICLPYLALSEIIYQNKTHLKICLPPFPLITSSHPNSVFPNLAN